MDDAAERGRQVSSSPAVDPQGDVKSPAGLKPAGLFYAERQGEWVFGESVWATRSLFAAIYSPLCHRLW
ncbi:hypothetical protein PSAC2689_40070 [Paraburkholderia sacchari]